MRAKYLTVPTLILLYAFTNTILPPKVNLVGTWRLVSGVEEVNGVKTVTDYTKDYQMIKIINASHFSFLKHSISASDSARSFDAGGGRYTLNGDKYTEHLDYYSNKRMEGHAFSFTVSMNNDTLVQRGVEKLNDGNPEKTIYERYVRVR